MPDAFNRPPAVPSACYYLASQHLHSTSSTPGACCAPPFLPGLLRLWPCAGGPLQHTSVGVTPLSAIAAVFSSLPKLGAERSICWNTGAFTAPCEQRGGSGCCGSYGAGSRSRSWHRRCGGAKGCAEGPAAKFLMPLAQGCWLSCTGGLVAGWPRCIPCRGGWAVPHPQNAAGSH